MVISVNRRLFRYFGSYSGISVIPVILVGNGSFRYYSRSDPGSFRSYSLSVRSFRPGSFRPDFWDESFRPNFGGSFRPTLFFIVFR